MKFSDSVPFIRFFRHGSIFSGGDSLMRAADHRLYLIDKGSGSLKTESRESLLTKGSLVYLPAGTRYHFSGKDMAGFLINFDYDNTRADHISFFPPMPEEQFADTDLQGCCLPDDLPTLCQPFILGGVLHYEDRFADLLQEYDSGTAYCRISASAGLKALLCRILREAETGSKTHEAVEIVLSYIRDHYAEPITNADLGAITGYHSHYINKLMLTGTGTTLRQYLVKYRLSRACEMLLESEKTLEEIAAETGFGRASYFCSVFKAKKGCPPSEYRQKCTLNT